MGKKTCPTCGRSIAPNYNRCPWCGHWFKAPPEHPRGWGKDGTLTGLRPLEAEGHDPL